MSSEIKSVIFNNVGSFRQAITFISNVCCANDIRVLLHSRSDDDGLTWVDFTTENGVRISVDAMTSSELWDEDACVYAKDLCIACDRMNTEDTVTMFIAENRLYVAGFYNEKLEGYELECGLTMHDVANFIPPKTIRPNEHIDIDQIACSTIIDSLYEFDFVEIIRKNGVISYRCGDESIVLATVMQSEKQVSAENTPNDLTIRIPAEVFRAIPMIGMMNMCSIDIDTANRRLLVKSSEIEMLVDYAGSELNTIPSTGLEDFCTMDSMAIAASIDTLFKVNYTDPLGIATLTADESGALQVTVTNKRLSLTLTVGEVQMNNEYSGSITIPLKVLAMMIRNTQCKRLTLKASPDGKTLMMCYSNGLFARKCTYIAK